MNRLLDQILSGHFLPPEPLDPAHDYPEWRAEGKGKIMEAAKRAVAVDVRNVYDWCMEELKKKLDLHVLHKEGQRIFTDLYAVCPNRLPFPSMWLEYGSMLEDHTGREYLQHGILLTEYSSPAEGETVMYFPGKEDKKLVTEILACRFMRLGTSIPVAIGAFALLPEIGGTGLRNISMRDCTEAKRYENFEADSKRILRNEMIESMFVSINSLIFFSCKNVSMRKGESRHKASRANLKKKGFPLPDFHVIEIHKFMEKNSRSRESHQYDRSIADAHVVRGHFKTYTEDQPLLGHAIGTYFWHAHVRGEGQPKLSDYRVWGPSKRHEKKCAINQ